MASAAYPDSSFLVSLHRNDQHHELARSFLSRGLFHLVFTPLHRLEVRNALRNAAASKAMTGVECRLAFRQIDEDLQAGLFVHTPIAWTDVFRRADELSEKHSAQHGQRAIDLLHVAIALESGLATFLSFDRRQRNFARAAGLIVKP